MTIPGGGRRIADDVLAFARANNVTQIVIGKSTRSRWFEILNGSVVHDLVRRSGNISVHVIAGDDIIGEPLPGKTVRTANKQEPPDPRPYLIAALAVAGALGVGELVRRWLGIENVDLVFLTAIVAVAVRFGLWPSLFASVAASLIYNFFFLSAALHLHDWRPKQFSGLRFLCPHGRARLECRRPRSGASHDRNRAGADDRRSLYAFSRKLAAVGTLDDVLWASAYQVALMLKVRVVLLLPEGSSIAVTAAYPPEFLLPQLYEHIRCPQQLGEKRRPPADVRVKHERVLRVIWFGRHVVLGEVRLQDQLRTGGIVAIVFAAPVQAVTTFHLDGQRVFEKITERRPSSGRERRIRGRFSRSPFHFPGMGKYGPVRCATASAD